MEFHHISVLLDETVNGLVTDPAGTYVDCTLGGGGHSHRIAELLQPEGRIIGIDQDADAVEAASRSLTEYTEESISAMVEKIVGAQVSEGSFDECAITFREIAEAKEVLCARLRTVYHTRIQYPE